MVQCESRGNPTAISPYGDAGLFQIASIHGYNVTWLQVPENNVRVAIDLYRRNGTRPWPNCP